MPWLPFCVFRPPFQTPGLLDLTDYQCEHAVLPDLSNSSVGRTKQSSGIINPAPLRQPFRVSRSARPTPAPLLCWSSLADVLPVDQKSFDLYVPCLSGQ
jgi:hypothetical protein